ncbi:unnamed protein product [Pedinophyceae sp. YPF-701]|nr:unnamed protein product [Pedinophyceae sp. YPF-701]
MATTEPSHGDAPYLRQATKPRLAGNTTSYRELLASGDANLMAALELFDRDGDGKIDTSELIQAHQAYERVRAEKALIRKVLIAAVVLCLFLVGATVGLTAVLIVVTKESKVDSSGLLLSADGSDTPVRTANRRGTVSVVSSLEASASRRALQGAPPQVAEASCAQASTWFQNIAKEGFDADIKIVMDQDPAVRSISARATVAVPPRTIEAYNQAVPTDKYLVDCAGVDLTADGAVRAGADCACPIFLTATNTALDSTSAQRRLLEEGGHGRIALSEVRAAAARHLGMLGELTHLGSIRRNQGLALVDGAPLHGSAQRMVHVTTDGGRSLAELADVSGGMRSGDGRDGRCVLRNFDPPIDCFSGDATLATERGLAVRIGDVRVGDRVAVRAPGGDVAHSPVVAVLHNEPRAVRVMVTVRTATKVLSATPSHYIYVRCEACAGGLERVRFDEVRAGMHEVATVQGGGKTSGWEAVTSVEVERKLGLHVVHTASGWPLLVGGVAASELSDNGLEVLWVAVHPLVTLLARLWPSGVQMLCDALLVVAHGASGETEGWAGSTTSRALWWLLRASSRALGGGKA